jgi:hypothetical protein
MHTYILVSQARPFTLKTEGERVWYHTIDQFCTGSKILAPPMRLPSSLSRVRTWQVILAKDVQESPARLLRGCQLFSCLRGIETPGDMPLFLLLGCENILVFVVEQMKTENFMQAFGDVAILGYEFSAQNFAMAR